MDFESFFKSDLVVNLAKNTKYVFLEKLVSENLKRAVLPFKGR